MPSLDPVVSTILHSALGLLFLAAAVHKLRDLPAFGTTLGEYRVVPGWATRGAAAGVAAAELLASIGLLAAVLTLSPELLAPIDPSLAGSDARATLRGALLGVAPGDLLAPVLLLAYTAAIAVNLARGRRDIDCGCAGPSLRQPLGWGLVVRNAILLGAALGCLAPSGGRPLTWLDALTATAAVGALAALYSAAQRLMVTAPRLSMLRRHLRQAA